MTIDLTKLKVGDTVKFRCGGQSIANMVEKSTVSDSFFIGFYDNSSGVSYNKAGDYTVCESPFDIIEVIPLVVPFDWSTVKRGMAFKLSGSVNDIYHYLTDTLNVNSSFKVFEDKYSMLTSVTTFHISNMIRAPEYDLKDV